MMVTVENIFIFKTHFLSFKQVNMSIIVFGVKCTEGMTNCVDPAQTE